MSTTPVNVQIPSDSEAPVIADFVEHALRVVGCEQAPDFGRAFCQRGKQQDAVRNAFGTGQYDGAVDAGNRGEVEVIHQGGLKQTSF